MTSKLTKIYWPVLCQTSETVGVGDSAFRFWHAHREKSLIAETLAIIPCSISERFYRQHKPVRSDQQTLVLQCHTR